jgi:hypothetical protein
METYVLAFMLALAPGRDVRILQPIAKAIAQSVSRREEAAALAAIQFNETSFHLRTVYPFGLTCCFNQARRASYQERVKAYLADPSSENEAKLVEDLSWAAQRTLQIYQRGERLCGNAYGSFWFFNTGECPTQAPPHSRNIARSRWLRGQHYARIVLSSVDRGRNSAPLPERAASR